MSFIAQLLEMLALAAFIIVFGRVLLSWIDPRSEKPVSQFVYKITEPFLAPIRNALPQTGGFDFSPMIVLFVLFLVMQVLRTI